LADEADGRSDVNPKYKMTTDIPASIITPDSVETRLGTLKFFDGFPDDATVQAVYDNLDFQRGVQAFLTALPAGDMCALREGYRAFGPDNQTLLVTESLMDSHTLYFVANTETVYNMAWLDTKNGLLVIETPPNVLGFMSDFWSRPVTDVGRTGPDRGQGGKYLLLPPGYTGAVPDGYFVQHSRTYGNAIFFRGFVESGELQPAVDNTKQHYRVYPLDRATNPPAMEFVSISGRYMNTIPPSDATLFELVDCSPLSASERTCRSRPTHGCRASSPKPPRSETPPLAPSSSARENQTSTTIPIARGRWLTKATTPSSRRAGCLISMHGRITSAPPLRSAPRCG
jgi:hypothetical protein